MVACVTVETQIIEKLSVLNPSHLEVVNESHMHSVPVNSETHFKVVIVSSEFESMRAVKRHQSVYGILKEELAGPIHALAIHAFSPLEWQGDAPDSPNCMGSGQ